MGSIHCRLYFARLAYILYRYFARLAYILYRYLEDKLVFCKVIIILYFVFVFCKVTLFLFVFDKVIKLTIDQRMCQIPSKLAQDPIFKAFFIPFSAAVGQIIDDRHAFLFFHFLQHISMGIFASHP